MPPRSTSRSSAWQKAMSVDGWVLVGCTVSPAFGLDGFRLAEPGWSSDGNWKEVFVHAYERSVEHYREVRQTLGEPDPFRLRYIDRIAELVGAAACDGLRLQDAALVVRGWAAEHAAPGDAERFREMAEGELLGRDEHNFARFRLRPSEHRRWRSLRDPVRDGTRVR